jgi:hypothetical protein
MQTNVWMGKYVFLVLALAAMLIGGVPLAADAAWTTDANGRAVVNGVPVFLRIAYDQWFDCDALPECHIATRNFDQYGFNVYLHFFFGSNENALKQLPALPSSMFGMATGNACCGHTVEEMGTNENGVQTFDMVNNQNNFRGRFNADPKQGGVYLSDEVDVGQLDNIRSWATTYKTSMPDTPRFVALLPEGPLIPTDTQYGSTGWMESTTGVANPYFWARSGAGGDWLAEDPYPLLFGETTRLAPWGFPHFWVADRAAHVVAAARQNGLVPVIVLQLFKGTSDSRFITPDELYSHMVMAVAEGVHGIAWWEIGRGSGLRAQEPNGGPVTDALKAVTLLLRNLEPIILSTPNPNLLVGNSTSTGSALSWREGVLDTVASAIQNYNYGAGGRGSYVAEKNALLAGHPEWSPMLDQSGDVRTRVWEDANGVGYVFAYNYHPLQHNGVTLTWHRNIQTIEVLGENRTITPNGASWTDDFGGSSSLNMGGKRIGHIYKITPAGGMSLVFTNPSNGATVSGTVNVCLAASGGSGTYTNYTVKLDGTTIYSGTNPCFSWNTAGVSSGLHTLASTVTDSTGATATAQITVTVPGGGLTAAITSPANGATVSGTVPVNISVSGAAAGSNRFRLSIDGTEVFNQLVAGTTASYSWNTTTASQGLHTLALTVTDSANASGSATISVTVNNPSPLSVDITQPTNGSTVSGTNWVIVWPHNFQGTPTCTITVGGVQVAQQPCPDSPTSIPWNTTLVGDGARTLTVTITDSTQRTGTSSVNITVANNTPPLTVDVTQPRNGDTVSGTSWVVVWPHNFQGTPTCTIKVDGTQVAQQTCSASPTSIPWNTTAFAEGAHTLTVTITDATTRTGTTSVSIYVSNTPLTVDITQPTNGSTVSGTNWVIVWPHNAQGTPTCTIKVGNTQVAQQACGSSPTSIPWNTTAFVNGAYTLTVTITDSTPRIGNRSVNITVSN